MNKGIHFDLFNNGKINYFNEKAIGTNQKWAIN